MDSFFNPGVSQKFIAYSPAHDVVLAISVILLLLLFYYRAAIRRHVRVRGFIRYFLLAGLIIPEAVLFMWYGAEGLWDVKYTLPLELCSISQCLAIILLLTRSRLLYQIVFFAGIGGALQAMLTPDLIYPYPHFRFFHFFIVHFAIIAAPLYMTWIYNFRPAWRSIGITMIFLNILVVVVGGVDYWLGSNYMFLRHKPEGASLIDVLGPYPYYLVSEEFIAFFVFTLMYLPFVRGHKEKRLSRS